MAEFTNQVIPSNETKARLFKTARFTQKSIDEILAHQVMAQCTVRVKHSQQSLSDMCFSVTFKGMTRNAQLDCVEPWFHLSEPDGTFFGYFFESALHLCL